MLSDTSPTNCPSGLRSRKEARRSPRSPKGRPCSANCRRSSSRRARSANGSSSSSFCRRWTPQARVGSSPTSSGPSTPTASLRRLQGAERGRAVARLSVACRQAGACGRRVRGLRPLALRRCAHRPGSVSWRRPRRSSAGTTRSTGSSANSSIRAPSSSRSCSTSAKTSRRSGSASRLEREDKHWKYNPADVDERMRWDDYQDAFQRVFERTSTDSAPVVRGSRRPQMVCAPGRPAPADRRSPGHAISSWPEVDYDIETEKKRLAES